MMAGDFVKGKGGIRKIPGAPEIALDTVRANTDRLSGSTSPLGPITDS